MYNPPRPILDMFLQGTAHSSEEIGMQGVWIWFVISSRVRVCDLRVMLLTVLNVCDG